MCVCVCVCVNDDADTNKRRIVREGAAGDREKERERARARAVRAGDRETLTKRPRRSASLRTSFKTRKMTTNGALCVKTINDGSSIDMSSLMYVCM